MRKWIVPAAALLLGWTAPAPAADLNVGDAAPKLAIEEFVKGDPIKSLEKGKIYVVEFWATWCRPCQASIPHLTELQKKYRDVAFLGVSIWEKKPEAVRPFVEEMGDRMGYRVAREEGAGETRPREGAMAKTWMAAAGEEGIPTAFIVNGEGKIAWIGHPLYLDRPLAQVVAGTWDLASAARKHKTELASKRKFREVRARLIEAENSGDARKVLAVVEEAVAGLADFAQGLNFVAWTVIEPDAKTKPDSKLLKLALQAAQRADDLVLGREADVADTLAKAYFDNGDVARAVETQERAVTLAEGTRLGTDPDLKRRLEQYRKAAKKE